jgi:hypothetical protein
MSEIAQRFRNGKSKDNSAVAIWKDDMRQEIGWWVNSKYNSFGFSMKEDGIKG